MDLSEATPACGSGEDTRRSLSYLHHRPATRRGRPARARQYETILMSDRTSNAASTVEIATVGEGEGDTDAFAFPGGERNR